MAGATAHPTAEWIAHQLTEACGWARAPEYLSLSETRPAGGWLRIGRCCCPMGDFCRLTWWALVGLFGSRRALEAENLVLRQQINVLRRTAPKRLLISSIDRLILVGLYRLFLDVRGALAIVEPDTVIRWQTVAALASYANVLVSQETT